MPSTMKAETSLRRDAHRARPPVAPSDRARAQKPRQRAEISSASATQPMI